MQAIGLGVGLLVVLALRGWRYRSDITTSYVLLWLAACIGLAIYSIVEAGLDSAVVAARLPIIFGVPVIGVLALRWVMKKAAR